MPTGQPGRLSPESGVRRTLEQDRAARRRGRPVVQRSGHVHPRAFTSSGQQPGAQARVQTLKSNHHPPSLGGSPAPDTRPPEEKHDAGPPGQGVLRGLGKGSVEEPPGNTHRARDPTCLCPPGPRAQEIQTRLKAVAFVYLNASSSPWKRRRAGEGGWGAGTPRPTADTFLCLAESRFCLQAHLSSPSPTLPDTVGGNADWCSH